MLPASTLKARVISPVEAVKPVRTTRSPSTTAAQGGGWSGGLNGVLAGASLSYAQPSLTVYISGSGAPVARLHFSPAGTVALISVQMPMQVSMVASSWFLA